MNVRPLTLHINTGKGTAVVQVQSSQQIPAMNTKRTPIHDTFRKLESQPQTSFQNAMSISGASSSAGALNPTTYCQSGPSSSSLTVAAQQQAVVAAAAAAHSRIFPTSITLPNAAAAAASTYFYQDPLNAFHNLVALQQNVAAMQQNVAAAANCVAKPSTATNYSATGPLFNSTAAKYLSPAAPFSYESHPSSNNATSHGAIHSVNRFEMQTSGSAATIGLSNNKAHSSPCHPSFIYQPGTALSTYNHQPVQNFSLGASPSASISCTTPGQSPRPGILRKRTADSGSAISASASKRLTYESVHSIQAKQTSAAIQRLLDVTGHLTSSDDILGPNMKVAAATLEAIESGKSRKKY
uniref:Uncharacterized protein n=1 Tax=Romanomermis culicivorax TaxID=13658 RepID=A0A915HYB6_ROMCU